jgi:excisionase family DNA binding protein
LGEQRLVRDREHDHVHDRERLTLLEAAEVLGISKDGVRMRVRRGKLPSSEMGADGRVFVFVDPAQDDVPPESSSEATHLSMELVEVLRA